MHRLKYWPKNRLQEEGLALMGVVARFRGRLFKEYIIRYLTLTPLFVVTHHRSAASRVQLINELLIACLLIVWLTLNDILSSALLS